MKKYTPIDSEDIRLPPGQNLTERFPVLQKGGILHLDRESYQLEIAGEVLNPMILTLDQSMAMKEAERTLDIHCVTTWSKFDTKWSGISFPQIFELVQPTANAHFIEFYCADGGFTTTVPMETCQDPDAMVALLYEGEPISNEHGGPVRGLFPKLYFYKSAKWLIKINFLNKDRPGYWERGGYSNKTHPWKNQRYSGDD